VVKKVAAFATLSMFCNDAEWQDNVDREAKTKVINAYLTSFPALL
jgi:hypothetical protein